MNARLTPEREAEIAARAEAAHPGPWHRSDDAHSLERYVVSDDDLMAISFGYRGNRTQAEADFVAHAREDVPALIAELATVRAERDELAEWKRRVTEEVEEFEAAAKDDPQTPRAARLMIASLRRAMRGESQ